jgi:hypothetical protein
MERGRFHQNRFPILKRLITAEKSLSLEETRSKSLKPAQYFFAVITAQNEFRAILEDHQVLSSEHRLKLFNGPA